MRICCFGDSLTLGTGDEKCLGWPGRLALWAKGAGYDLTVYNMGVRADILERIKDRWPTEAAARIAGDEPSGFILNFGVADVMNNIDADKTILAARQFVKTASATCPTVVIGPFPVLDPEKDSQVAALSSAFGGVCKDLDVPYLPMHISLSDTPEYADALKAGDGAHPCEDGYEAIALRICQWGAWRALIS
ncbi:MAG: GDSL-type esterase/lipase family protein [Desulfovibrio sp.]|uniref:GDSL-type esterase/lipase family protein n=1 Tax=Desulfovibrio sp. 7SRBS1 TaxID=3378064 RepID=UPI003B405DDA